MRMHACNSSTLYAFPNNSMEAGEMNFETEIKEVMTNVQNFVWFKQERDTNIFFLLHFLTKSDQISCRKHII